MENAIGMTDEEFKKINSVFDELAALKDQNEKLKEWREIETKSLELVVGVNKQLQADKAELLEALKDLHSYTPDLPATQHNSGFINAINKAKSLLQKHEAK